MTEQKKPKLKKPKLKIYDFDEVVLVGRDTAEVGPHTITRVLPSPEGHVPIAGTKCEHGGYIPATHPDPNRAPYCSICYPYILTRVGDKTSQEPGSAEPI